VDEHPQVPIAIGAFVFASLGWLLVTGVSTGLAVTLLALARGVRFEVIAADPESFVTAGIMGFSALLQSTGIGVVALLLARGLSDHLAEARAAAIGRVPGWSGWIVAGSLGALTVGLFPGWIAAQILGAFPDLGSGLTLLGEVMQRPDPIGKTLLVLAICVTAPLFEEVAFRGYLWHHLERVMPGWAVWLLTTLMFAAYHLDPVQSPSLIPTALLLGWLRWHSGGIAAPVAAHFVNNLLGTFALLNAGGDESSQIGLGVAALGTSATISCCAIAWLARPRT